MIRKAETSDVSEISRLLKQVLQVHFEGRPDIFVKGSQKYTENELKDIISNSDTPIFVYDNSDGTISGYVFCVIEKTQNSNNLKDRTTVYIDDLCVDSLCRGNGIGTKLFEYVKDFAKASGYDGITLNVWQFNESAMSFYKKMGMTPLKTVMEYNF